MMDPDHFPPRKFRFEILKNIYFVPIHENQNVYRVDMYGICKHSTVPVPTSYQTEPVFAAMTPQQSAYYFKTF